MSEVNEIQNNEVLPVTLTLEQIVPLVESVVFASGEGIEIEKLVGIIGCDEGQIFSSLELLDLRYKQETFGIELVRLGKKYQFRTKAQFAEPIRLLKEERPKRLSIAALETLAIIAYRQPIVKSEVEAIRGVDATPTIKTLLERNLIKIAGHQPTVGSPALYGTTEDFLKLFSLGSLTELPTLRDLAELDSDPGESTEQIHQEASRILEQTLEENLSSENI